MNRSFPWRLTLFLGLLGSVAYLYTTGRIQIPDTWNPWAPLQLEQPLHAFTRLKLSRLKEDAAQCRAVLDSSDMSVAPLPVRDGPGACGYTDGVRVARTSAELGESLTLSCPTAVALALWERHVLQPAALQHLGSPVTRLDHFGTYACRNIYGRKNAPLSRHSTAEAIDVAGFVTADRQRVTVLRDWGRETPQGRFIQAVHAGACRVFDGVLGPGYNAAHRDHFHFDRGGWRACR